MIYTLHYIDIKNDTEVHIEVRKYSFNLKGKNRDYLSQLGNFLEWLDVELKDLTEGELMEALDKEFKYD